METEEVDVVPGLVRNDDGKIVYEASYDGYWRWCEDTGRDQMVMVLREYSDVLGLEQKMRPASSSAFALGHALREMRVRLFDEISRFLSCKAGRERMKTLRLEFLDAQLQARSSSGPSALRTPRQEAVKSETAVHGRSQQCGGSKDSHKHGRGGVAEGAAKEEAN